LNGGLEFVFGGESYIWKIIDKERDGKEKIYLFLS
jgi:hypothetical protein